MQVPRKISEDETSITVEPPLSKPTEDDQNSDDEERNRSSRYQSPIARNKYNSFINLFSTVLCWQ